MNKGVFYAAGAYALWGFFPLYFKALHIVPPFQIMTHRVVWSFLFLVLILLLRKEIIKVLKAVTWKIMLVYLLAGILLATNWLTYVWAVNAGFVVEASLGYFINPLVSVLLGVVFLRERLRPLQWLPIGLAALGVTYMTISVGSLPWIALVLAFTFGLYGLIKKLAPLGSLHGVALETTAIVIPALGYLLFQEWQGTGSFGHINTKTTFLLSLTGIITATPLLLFASGAQRVPLTTIGLLQYISPTLQFLIGVLVYAEPFNHERVIGFTIIWIALIVFSIEGFLEQRRKISAISTVS